MSDEPIVIGVGAPHMGHTPKEVVYGAMELIRPEFVNVDNECGKLILDRPLPQQVPFPLVAVEPIPSQNTNHKISKSHNQNTGMRIGSYRFGNSKTKK